MRVIVIVSLVCGACSPVSSSTPTPMMPVAPGSPLGDAGPPPPGAFNDGDLDTIGDWHEGNGAIDTDLDGLPDSSDLDSDGDGLTDNVEAGDADVMTPPIDTDFDGVPNFRDLDSDGDGVADAIEPTRGTDPLRADSDGDGADDLVEIAAGTSPTDAAANPRVQGDFFFTVPYMLAPTPERDTLVFEATLRKADVFFVIDTSISMQDYIDNVRDSLRTRIVPGLAATIEDVQFGVGQFDVIPEFRSHASLSGTCVGVQSDLGSTSDLARVESALSSLTADCRPVPEPYAQAIYLWASGNAGRFPPLAPPACAPGTVGLGCARPDAIPIIMLIGDEPYQESYTNGRLSTMNVPSVDEITAAMNAVAARLIVLGPTARRGDAEYRAIALGTGSVDASGQPLIFPDATSESASTAAVDAVARLANGARLDVSARAKDLDDDGVDATVFIERIEANVTGGVADPTNPARVCVGGLPAEDRNGDGALDTFIDVPGSSAVCFDVIPRMNTTVPALDHPQLFRAEIEVIGDGVTLLDTRNVFFLVPPTAGGSVDLL